MTAEPPHADVPTPADDTAAKDKRRSGDPVRRVTWIVLLVCVVLFTWNILSDRLTPYTDQARIRSITAPITPRVAGNLAEVNVRLHSIVQAGDVLFKLDQRPFDLAIRSAEANLDLATQNVGAGSATVKAAVARLGVARAQLDRAQRNFNRVERVLKENPGALSQADWDRAETALAQATERVASSEADLEKAKQQLGEAGPNNAQIRGAIAALEQAQLDREFSVLHAPYDGAIESFNVDVGTFAQAGMPLATLVSPRDVWIQADMRENNLGRLAIGQKVEFSLDVAPGHVFTGQVRSIGFGVDAGGQSNAGGLPTIKESRGWLRDPQRFPVIVSVDENVRRLGVRVGGQADVVVYTGQNPLFNAVAWVQMRVRSVLSYVH